MRKLIILLAILFLLNAFIIFSQAQYYKITVSTSGNGYVTSSPSGILCGAVCSETYNSGTVMTLTAVPNEGQTFISWDGCDKIEGNTCTVTLNSDKSVLAKFSGQTATEYTLTVYKSGEQGTVKSEPYGIDLGIIAPYDSAKFKKDTEVKLTASPSSGNSFVKWMGDCSGTKNTCTLIINSSKTVTAEFGKAVEKSIYGLTIEKTSEPSGLTGKIGGVHATATSSYAFTCRSSDGGCVKQYQRNEVVTLKALPESGYAFVNWSGDGSCSGTNVECKITMNADRKVIAVFKKAAVQETKQRIHRIGEAVGEVAGFELKQGWNLVGVPFEEPTYLKLEGRCPQRGYILGNNGDFINVDLTLDSMKDGQLTGKGLWVKRERDTFRKGVYCKFIFKGNFSIRQEINIHTGWNLISVQSGAFENPENIELYQTDTPASIFSPCPLKVRFAYYDPLTKKYLKNASLIPGVGYLVYSQSNCLLSASSELEIAPPALPEE